MKVTYRLEVKATCPVDDSVDVYELTVVTHELVTVEAILEAVGVSTQQPVYQEILTAAVKAELGDTVCTVTTVGWHSGVETTVRC